MLRDSKGAGTWLVRHTYFGKIDCPLNFKTGIVQLLYCHFILHSNSCLSTFILGSVSELAQIFIIGLLKIFSLTLETVEETARIKNRFFFFFCSGVKYVLVKLRILIVFLQQFTYKMKSKYKEELNWCDWHALEIQLCLVQADVTDFFSGMIHLTINKRAVEWMLESWTWYRWCFSHRFYS